jgi:hypothetical protein
MSQTRNIELTTKALRGLRSKKQNCPLEILSISGLGNGTGTPPRFPMPINTSVLIKECLLRNPRIPKRTLATL